MPNPSASFMLFFIVLISAYILFLGVIFFVARISALLTEDHVQRRWKAKQSIIAEYEAPLNLSPAEVGFLFDRIFSENELRAVVLQLIQKNHLAISHTDQGIMVSVTSNGKELQGLELLIYEYATSNATRGQLWNDLGKHWSEGASEVHSHCKQAVIDMLVSKDLYSIEGSLLLHFLEKGTALVVSFVLTAVTVFLPLYFIYHATHNTGLNPGYQSIDQFVTVLLILPAFVFVWWLLYLYSNVVAYIYFSGAGLPLGATRLLRQVWPEIAGYRQYLMVVEFERQNVALDIQNPALPYCAALGFRPNLLKLLS